MKIAIIENKLKDKDSIHLKRIISLCEKLNIEYYISPRSDNSTKYIYTDPSNFPSDVNVVISIGGDGTILQASRDIKETNLPIAGINLGTLGYLAETEINQVEDMLIKLKTNEFIYENRMMIDGFKVTNEGKVKHELSQALNDIVIKSKDAFKTVALNLYVNGKFVTKYYADGLMVSTPTGSTAYNLSAGGPIIEPTTKMMIVTPICSFAHGLGSIVFGGSDDIVLEVCKGRKGELLNLEAMFDGVNRFELKTGDSLEIKKSNYEAKFIKFTETSFLEILREKMKK